MEKKEQVFLYMKEEIERLASLEEEKILTEAKQLEEEAYNQIKAEAKKDAEALLAKELVEISSNASVEASLSQEEKTKRLVEKRDEYVTNIFSEAKEKLVEFVNSKDYKTYLIKHIEEIGKLYQMENSTLKLRKVDMKYKDELIKAYGMSIEVEVSDKILIGGFIIENKATNVVVDESLDFALENQKDWFYKTSGLMIK
ncbi:MAG: V-type ATP synthase subunit E [Thomasclavelia sp.]|uniref:V-type ATP synthase subunit E n=1 Tax=Thomasclavelia sp. TaxID=3025757 RepID=UPI00399F655F